MPAYMKHMPPLLLAAILTTSVSAQTANAPEKRIAVTVDAGKTRAPISPYLYGQFIEHIGDLVNRSVWAEMLDDRKFYYDINSDAAPQVQSRPGPLRRRQPNRWRPIGPDSAVVMDRDHPYVGEHSPLIRLAGTEARGIQQAGLVLRKSKAYSARVVLAGEPGAAVAVTLVWGAGAGRAAENPDHRSAINLRQVPLEVHGRRRHRQWTHRDRGNGRRLVSRRSGVTHAGRQRPGLSAGDHRSPEAAPFGNVPVPRRQLPVGA